MSSNFKFDGSIDVSAHNGWAMLYVVDSLGNTFSYKGLEASEAYDPRDISSDYRASLSSLYNDQGIEGELVFGWGSYCYQALGGSLHIQFFCVPFGSQRADEVTLSNYVGSLSYVVNESLQSPIEVSFNALVSASSSTFQDRNLGNVSFGVIDDARVSIQGYTTTSVTGQPIVTENFDVLGNAFQAVGSVLDTPIWEGFTLGTAVFFPVLFGVLIFFVKAIK